MSGWERMMAYCDGNDPYAAECYTDTSLEHLRTDIHSLNDVLRERISTLVAERKQREKMPAERLRSALDELVKTHPSASRDNFDLEVLIRSDRHDRGRYAALLAARKLLKETE